MVILTPESEADFERYFDLRWRVLREPWQQPRGSERDDLDASSWHRMACLEGRIPVGVARLHLTTPKQAQLRYMAVEPACRRMGVGAGLALDLEALARAQGVSEIVLQAREHSVAFYSHLGYRVTGAGHTLFGTVRHLTMRKPLA